MTSKTLYNTLLRSAITLVLVVVLWGCNAIDDPVYELPSNGDFHLALTIQTSNSSTRAGHEDSFEEIGTDAENYIDMNGNDYKVVLFDKSGNFILDIDGSEISFINKFEESNSIYYTIEKDVEFPEEFDQNRKESIQKNGMQVMVLANWKGMGRTGYDNIFTNGENHQTLSQIWKDNTNYNFFYKDSPKSGNDAERQTWYPQSEIAQKELIPMFGLSTTTGFSKLNNGGYRTDVIVPMQRALAKIEVIDEISNNQPGFRMREVVMTNHNTYGRFIPDVEANTEWDKIGMQVNSSSLPASVGNVSRNLHFIKENPASNVWVAYVPEMCLSPTGNKLFSDSRARLDVKLESDNDMFQDMLQNAVYSIHFGQYDPVTSEPSIPDESWNHILRNHIYRFEVRRVGVKAEIELHVKPWVLDDDEDWDFTDNITIQQPLVWKALNEKEMTYETLDKSNGKVLLWIDPDKDRILTGTFNISTPLNGRWIARLTPLDDASPNAMSFVDEKGNALLPNHGDPAVCLEVSGIVEKSNPAIIRIRPTKFSNDFMSAYKLEFYVENMGVWTKVSLVNDDDRDPGSSFDYYTIVRKNNTYQ